MRLNFVGKGSAFYPPYGNTGAYFVNGSELYLIDCGESMFEAVYRRVELPKIERVYVLLTHLHADHVGSLGTLISYFYCLFGRQVTVVHPEDTIRELLRLLGIDERGYLHCKSMPENGAGLTAEAVPVVHAADMKCYGYVLSDGTESVYYSGDSSDLPEEIRGRFLAGEIARIYHDTSSKDSPHPSHCYYGKLEAKIPESERGRVYCMHLDGPWEELLREKGFQIAEVAS